MSEDPAFAGAIGRLAKEYRGIFSPETIARCFDESLERWEDAPVRMHLPILAERFVRERLQARAQAKGMLVKGAPEVLFVCVHNAGRRMAAALLDHHAQGRIHVRSAGSMPTHEIHPNVVIAMEEQRLDLSSEFPKPLTDEVVEAADVVVTMGCGDACPVYPGNRYLDWDLEDPATGSVGQVRAIRGEIDRRVRELLRELVPVTAKSLWPVASADGTAIVRSRQHTARAPP